MARIFSEMGVKADCLLPFEEFKLYSDLKETVFVPEKLDKIVKAAQAKAVQPIPLMPLSVFLQFRENGNRTNYQNLHFERRITLQQLAYAEAYERKGRFVTPIADMLWAIMEESTWMIPAHMYNCPTHSHYGVPPVFNDDRMHGIDLFSAATGALLAVVHSLLKDELDKVTPVINEKLLYMLNDRLVKPFLHCVFKWTGERGNGVNNWAPWISSNLLTVTALTVKDPYLREEMVSKCMMVLDNFTSFYEDDGGCTEGPSYWGSAGASYFDSLEILEDMSGGKINVYGHPLVKNMFEYIVKFNINGKRFINFADSGPNAHHDGTMLRRMGEKVGSESLCAFGDTMAAIADGGCGYDQFTKPYRTLKNYYSKAPAAGESKAETKIWFPNLKVMAARESSDPSKGMFVAMKGGSNGEDHNHNDVGNVVIYYNGNPVFIDTGAGTYTKTTFSPQRYTLWFMQSNYHNLPAFGGVAEMQGLTYFSTDEVYDPESGKVKMQLRGAYPKEAGLVSYTRETVLDKDAVVNITDEFELDTEKEVDFRFMTCAKPILNADGTISLAEGRTMEFDPKLACEIEEFEVKDGGIERSWASKVLWRIHFRITSNKDKVFFKVR